MSEMVERVARAIAEARFGIGCPVDGDDRIAARAAIEAMREPLDRVPGGWGRGAWIEGIDAALREKQDG